MDGSPRPLAKHGRDPIAYLRPRLASLATADKQVIVWRLSVTNVRDDGQADRVLVQGLRGATAAYATTVFAARVLGDLRFAPLGTARIELPDTGGEPDDVLLIQLRPPLCGARPPCLSGRSVGRALLLCPIEGVLLDQQPLALVSLACLTPFEDDRRETGVFTRTAREGCIA